MQQTAHVAPWKREEVKRLVEIISQNPVIALANVEGIPAAQMQAMRRQLREHATVKVAKNTLLTRAFEEAAKSGKDQVDDLTDRIEGQVALIATDMNPFKLFKMLEAAKTKAPAKGGETAPEDINVEKGETPFKPGPVVGDLQKAGIPAAIEGGKVVIKQNKTLVEAGDTIPRDVAQMLTRLEIHPLTVGMDLRAAFEDGIIFDKTVLDVDEEAFISDLKAAAARGFNLAVNSAWFTSLTAQPILAGAHTQALNLGVNAAVTEPGIVDRLVGKANAQALALASNLSEDARDDELNERLSGAALASGAGASSAPSEPADAAAAEEDEDEEEEEDEVSEEEAAGGLGALFG